MHQARSINRVRATQTKIVIIRMEVQVVGGDSSQVARQEVPAVAPEVWEG